MQLSDGTLLHCGCGAVDKTEVSFKCGDARHGSEFVLLCSEREESDSCECARTDIYYLSYMCQDYGEEGEITKADFLCRDCPTDRQYLCIECFESVHKKRPNHRYQKLESALKLKRGNEH